MCVGPTMVLAKYQKKVLTVAISRISSNATVSMLRREMNTVLTGPVTTSDTVASQCATSSSPSAGKMQAMGSTVAASMTLTGSATASATPNGNSASTPSMTDSALRQRRRAMPAPMMTNGSSSAGRMGMSPATGPAAL